MSRSALASRSAVLVMHAVFQVPSVVAVPSSRPVIASKRDGSCIPGLQSIRNNVRNEVSSQAPTDVTSGRVAVGHVLIAGACSLVMPTIVKEAASMCAAPFDRSGERKSGECLGATVASLSRNLAECALPPLIGRELDWSHEPTRAEYALSPQLWLPSHELNRNGNCASEAGVLGRAAAAAELLRAADGDAAAALPRAASIEAGAMERAVGVGAGERCR